jgi:heterodisulfide reductase subunit B
MSGASADGTVEEVDKILEEQYRGEVRVRHLLDILVSEYGLEALEEQVVRPLTGLRVAAYYGCLLVRPPELVAFDDPENPTAMDRLAETLGADSVEWSGKIECCGASLSLARTDVVVKLTADIFEAATAAGADCIIVACPLCQANLDMRQAQVNRRYRTDYQLPIVYFTQLVGLALGIDDKRLGLDKLLVSPKRMLQLVVPASSTVAAADRG